MMSVLKLSQNFLSNGILEFLLTLQCYTIDRHYVYITLKCIVYHEESTQSKQKR